MIASKNFSPRRLFLILLGISMCAETAIMSSLPVLWPDQSPRVHMIVNVGLLILLTAPLIWQFAIKPLQQVALHERAYSTAILRHAVEGFLTLNRQGRITSCNPAVSAMFGRTEAELVGQPIALIIPDLCLKTQGNQDFIECWKSSLEGGRSTIDTLGQRKDASILPVEFSGNVFQIEGADMLIAVLRDATERTQNFEKLRLARVAAEAANLAKSQFLANMSHELRTPLNGVLGYSQILQQTHGVSDEQRQYLRSIQRCGDHLLTLINDVLDLARIESGKLEVHVGTCDLATLLLDVRDVVVPKAIEKGLQFSFDITPGAPQMIRTDPPKMRQVLVNLLANAIKFTPAGSVTLRISKSNENEIRFQVIDTGPGIPPDQLDGIFEPFKQFGKHQNTVGGTGLGLSISRRLTASLGGSLSVDSEVGKGSCFSIVLPVSHVENAGTLRLSDDALSVQGHQVLAPDQQLTVLIADDNETNRDLLVRLLAYSGIKTIEAVNGKDAMNKLRKYRMPLILLDAHMPEMDGFEVVKAVRADADLRQTAIIIVSADVLSNFQDKLDDTRFDDFIGKPLRITELLSKIAKHAKVRFVDQASTQPASLTSDDRPRLPAATAFNLAERLRNAAEINSLTELNALASELQKQPDPICQYGKLILRLAAEFDFEGIANLADSLFQSAPANKE